MGVFRWRYYWRNINARAANSRPSNSADRCLYQHRYLRCVDMGLLLLLEESPIRSKVAHYRAVPPLDFACGKRYLRDTEARYPSGKGEVCKTFMRGFDSHPRLQQFLRFRGLRLGPVRFGSQSSRICIPLEPSQSDHS
jgi:hypothetical protein